MTKETGTVKWFNDAKGFGFITRENGEDVFVHHSEIKMDGFKTLRPDQKVSYTIATGDKGLKAEGVTPEFKGNS